MTSEKGLEHRSKRPIEVEAVFGQIKSNNKFNRFTFAGLEKVEMELLLMILGHNFRKIMAVAVTSGKTVFKTIISWSGFVVSVEISICHLPISQNYQNANLLNKYRKLVA